MGQISGSIGLKKVPPGPQGYTTQHAASIRRQMSVVMENINKVIRHVENITPDALAYGLLPIHTESLKLVPKDTWRLHDSGYITTGQRGSTIWAEVGFAKGGNPPYAVRVHEMTELYHTPPTRAKYLQVAYAMHSHKILRRVQTHMKRSLGS